jgi:hypothetical protein
VSDLSAWVLSIGSFAAIVLLTAFAAKSFVGDAARGRRRCPRCWHELGPAPAIEREEEEASQRARQCSECGFVAAREADTRRTRRRVGLGILAVVAILAIVGAARVRFLDQGAWSMAPTRALIAISRHVGDGGYRSPQSELASRIRAGLLDDAQLRDAVDLVVQGDGDGTAGSREWQDRYGGIAQALLAVIPRQDPLLLRFLEIPPEIVVEFHAAREGRTPLLGIDAYPYWPQGIESRLSVEFSDGTVRLARFNPRSRGNHLLVEVPPSHGLGDKVRLVLAVRSLGGSFDAPWIEYPGVYSQIPRIVGRAPAEPDAAPIDTQEMRDTVAQVFVPDHALAVWSGGTPRAGLSFNNAGATRLDLAGVLFGLRVEICEDGVVRRTSRIWWHGGGEPNDVRWLAPIEDIDALARLWAQDQASDSRWTLRITGDPDLADYARPPVAAMPRRDGFKYWSGTLEFPLRVQREPTPSVERRWTLQK